MPEISKLVPETVTARAVSRGKLGGACGPRFFLGLLLGLVWLGPAWLDIRFLYAMALWDALMALAWLADWRRLPRPQELSVSRVWSEPLSQGAEATVALEVSNASSFGFQVKLEDDLPASLSAKVPEAEAQVPGARGELGVARLTYSVQPTERGNLRVGGASLRYQGSLKLAERWAGADLAQTVRVYPNLQESKRYAFYLIRSRQIELEKRFKRQPGMGREFESLREYRQGDEPRDVCWTASARRAKLISRVYRVERSQSVIIVVDDGRLMLARVTPILDSGFAILDSKTSTALPARTPHAGASGKAAVGADRESKIDTVQNPKSKIGLTKLDYAVTAALSLAHVALHSGDSVGLLAYGRKVHARLGAARGASHLRAFLERLAMVKGELVEADHARAADLLLTEQKRRSLIVWLTDLAETAATPEVIESASRLLHRHLVLFVAIGQPELGQLVARRPASVEEMYRYVAAQEMIERRELLLRRLRERGAMTLEVLPGQLATGLVNQYLEVKERSLL